MAKKPPDAEKPDPAVITVRVPAEMHAELKAAVATYYRGQKSMNLFCGELVTAALATIKAGRDPLASEKSRDAPPRLERS